MAEARSLNDIMKSEFGQAKKYLKIEKVLEIIVSLIAIGSIILNKEDTAFVVLSAFFGTLAIFVFREISTLFYSKGEKLRRLFLIQQGLGIEPEESDLFDIYANAAGPKTSEPDPVGSYYSSKLEKGYPRLLQQIQESAYWTSAQAKLTMVVHYTIAVIGILVTFTLAFLWLRLPHVQSTPGTIDFSKLFATLLLFFISGSTLSSARSYQSLAQTSKIVADEAARLRKSSVFDPVSFYKLLSSYDAALIQARPLPSYSYKLLQGKLNEAYGQVIAREEKI